MISFLISGENGHTYQQIKHDFLDKKENNDYKAKKCQTCVDE